MPFNTSVITRKGQITIPIEIRKALGLHEGDRVMFIRDGDDVRLTSAMNVTQRTAGSLRRYRLEPPLTIAEEKEGFAQAIVDDWLETEKRMREGG